MADPAVMADHFVKVQKLPNPIPRSPNFRKVPLCARPSYKIGEYAEFGNVTRDMIKEQEVDFLNVCKASAEENVGKLKFVDINKKESEI